MSSVSYWILGQAYHHNCIGAVVFSGIGYMIMMGYGPSNSALTATSSLMFKEYRIFKLFLSDAKKLRTKALKDEKLLAYLALLLAIEVSIIVLWLTVSPFETTYYNCRPANGTFMSLFIFFKVCDVCPPLISPEGIVVLANLYLGYKARHVEYFAEGWNLLIASVIAIGIGTAFIVLVFTVPLTGTNTRLQLLMFDQARSSPSDWARRCWPEYLRFVLMFPRLYRRSEFWKIQYISCSPCQTNV